MVLNSLHDLILKRIVRLDAEQEPALAALGCAFAEVIECGVEGQIRIGDPVTAASVGMLAAIGKKTALVFRRPKIAVITLGNNLVESGDLLWPGKSYDSDSPMLKAALLEMSIHPFYMKRLNDELHKVSRVIGYAFKETDVLLLTSDLGAGAEYLPNVLRELQIRELSVQTDPSLEYPFYFGKNAGCHVFGMPIERRLLLDCFYGYVYPAIRRLMGFKKEQLFAGPASAYLQHSRLRQLTPS